MSFIGYNPHGINCAGNSVKEIDTDCNVGTTRMRGVLFYNPKSKNVKNAHGEIIGKGELINGTLVVKQKIRKWDSKKN